MRWSMIRERRTTIVAISRGVVDCSGECIVVPHVYRKIKWKEWTKDKWKKLHDYMKNSLRKKMRKAFTCIPLAFLAFNALWLLSKISKIVEVYIYIEKPESETITSIMQMALDNVVSYDDDRIEFENISTILGDHMKSVEFLPLQRWQINAIHAAYNTSMKPKDQRNYQAQNSICLPPASHMSRDFCCGGIHQRLRYPTSVQGTFNNIFRCKDKTIEDFDKSRKIALRHMIPLPSSSIEKCDICQIVETLRKQNLSMAIIGDSVTHQMVDGLMCALQSRNYVVVTQMAPNDGTAFDLHISTPNWNNTSSTNTTRATTTQTKVTIKFIHSYFLHNMPWSAIFNNTDIIITNHGLHYGINATRKRLSPNSYLEGIHRAFSLWNSFSVLPRLLIFRETSSQHFPSDSGEYFLWDKSKDPEVGCSQHADTTYLGWREAIVKQAAKEHGFDILSPDLISKSSIESKMFLKNQSKRLGWLPFLNLIAELHFMHGTENWDGAQDCSHYCQSPYLWWPTWRSLRILMEFTFSSW